MNVQIAADNRTCGKRKNTIYHSDFIIENINLEIHHAKST